MARQRPARHGASGRAVCVESTQRTLLIDAFLQLRMRELLHVVLQLQDAFADHLEHVGVGFAKFELADRSVAPIIPLRRQDLIEK